MEKYEMEKRLIWRSAVEKSLTNIENNFHKKKVNGAL